MFSFGRGKKPAKEYVIVKDLLAIMHRNALSLTGKCPLKDAVIKYNRIGQRREKSHVIVTSSNRPFSWKLNASGAPSEALREESKFWSELLGELETVIHLFKRFFVYKTNLS